MMIMNTYKSDIDILISKQLINGGEYWTTSDGAIGKGGPFSTLEVCNLLIDLGVPGDSKIMKDIAIKIFENWMPDGRIRTYTKGSVYPCQTANAARILSKLGHIDDERLMKTIQYFFKIQEEDGGWRCNTYKYGRGPETEYSNPGTTLTVLEVFTYYKNFNYDERLNKAVDFLLKHWEIKKPLGPCHFGIGTLFMKVEYPLTRYNILNYLFVLSYYRQAIDDYRFIQAYDILRSKLNDNMIVIENSNKKIIDLKSCQIDGKSELGTLYLRKIEENIKKYSSDL
jgi:hypothetical protein